MQMIMIAGKAGSGKTTLAKMLSKHIYNHGLVPVLASFAGPLKEEAANKGYDKVKFPEKYREFCQELGAAAREGDPDHWVNLMRIKIAETRGKEEESIANSNACWEHCIIVDDCRYMNEINLGIETNASILFLTTGQRGLEEHEWRTHESEALANDVEEGNKDLLEVFDHLIFNDRDEKSLEKRITDMVPIWCGMSVDPGKEGELLCSCPSCRDSRLGGKSSSKHKQMEEFLDLLDLFGEEDEDEDTE
jgi:hypothetical protein